MRELTNARRWRWVIGALGLRLHARPRLWAFEESAAGLSPCIPILRSGQAKARLSAGTNAGGVSMRSTPPRRFAPPLLDEEGRFSFLPLPSCEGGRDATESRRGGLAAAEPH